MQSPSIFKEKTDQAQSLGLGELFAPVMFNANRTLGDVRALRRDGETAG